jgi:hypothetical protein
MVTQLALNDDSPFAQQAEEVSTGSLHADLSSAGLIWLLGSQKHEFAATEIGAQGGGSTEIADVWGWGSKGSTLIEVKVSRADFLADAKKPHRQRPEIGLGRWRYYLTPRGLLTSADLPEGWGLLEPYRKGSLSVRRKSSYFEPDDVGWNKEQRLLVGFIRDGQFVLAHRRNTYWTRQAEDRESENCIECDKLPTGSPPHSVFDHIYTGNGYRLARLR